MRKNMIEIATVGGYSEVGRNMTAVKYNDEVVLLDMGIHLERYINFKGDEDLEVFNTRELMRAGAIPDDSSIKDWRKKVVAIVPSHGHLDHIGAIPYMASRYDAPIIATPFTAAVIESILSDKKISLDNEIIVLKAGNKIKITDSITVEFINVTHSIPDTAIVVIHTPDGQVVYTNDFKFDNSPVIGDTPDYDRLTELGDNGHVAALILDSLYADTPRKTPSESLAKEMLKEVLLGVNSKGKGVVVTTFSSHIARLKSIVEFGSMMNRRIVFLGRSLARYVFAAQSIGIADFSKTVEIVPYKSLVTRALKRIDKEGRDKYLIVSTGHQGEPDAVLSRLADRRMGLKLNPDDHVIFSTAVIPSPLNMANRDALEAKLKEQKVRIFRDIHQSGHASREDHRDMIKMLRPRIIIPSHAPPEKTIHMAGLAEEMGYKLGRDVHIMKEGARLEVK
jgi:ribonuclease J